MPLKLTNRLIALASITTLAVLSMAQVPAANKANWKLADRFSAEALRPYTYGTTITPGWINKTDSFWYQWRGQDGVHFWKVDCKIRKKGPLFDTGHMAALLSVAVKKPYDNITFPITALTFDEKNDNLIKFTVETIRFEYDIAKDTLKEVGRGRAGVTPPAGGGGQGQGNRGGGGGAGGGQGRFGTDFHNYSPDKKAYVYAQDHNLFYVEVKDSKDQPPVQLTKDGEKFYSFGSRADVDEQRQQLQQQLTVQQIQQQQQQQDQGDQTQQNQGNSRDPRVRVNATWSKVS
jgi:dipeptidyl-peptidase-4